MISGSRDAHLNITDVETGNIKLAIPAHNYAVNSLAMHDSGNFFASASRDKSLKIWDAKNYQFINKLDSSSGGHINCISIFIK